MLAIRFARTGGPEVLEAQDMPRPEPGPDQVLVRNEAVGVNFIDTYHRGGLYPVELPSGLGSEGAGVVEAVGPRVQGFAPGDRVAYAVGPLGAYAEFHTVAADRLLKLPDAISTRQAAAIMLKGMTAEFLLRRCYPLQPGEACLIWAASGGVGSILTQWAKAIGATVIACVGNDRKAAIARRHGADHVILYRTEDVAARVREITGGAGVRVSYDGVGKASFEPSLKSLGRRGMLVTFGNASGPVPAIEPLVLSRAGSLFLTRPTLFDYIATRAELEQSAAALFEAVGSGKVRVEIGEEFALKDARRAHERLQGGETTGSLLLIP
jgi:NADPH2:quinone reductase